MQRHRLRLRLVIFLFLFVVVLPPSLTAILWARSHWVEDDLQFLRDTSNLGISDGEGKFGIKSTYFTLASHSGVIAFVYFRDSLDVPLWPASSVKYYWCRRNFPSQPGFGTDHDLAYPISGSNPWATPLFGPAVRLKDENEEYYFEGKLGFWYRLGFLYDDGSHYTDKSFSLRIWYCPWWFIAVLSLAPLLLYFSRRLYRHLRRRARIGLCPTCSYDLRAHHPGDKCPECGATILQKQA